MRREDGPALKMNLEALAETYDRKMPGPKAMQVWFDVLKEFAVNDVAQVLIDWPRYNSKFPSPSDVFKTLNERAIDSREAVAKAEKAKELAELGQLGATPRGKWIIRQIRNAIVSNRGPEFFAALLLKQHAAGFNVQDEHMVWAESTLERFGISHSEAEKMVSSEPIPQQLPR